MVYELCGLYNVVTFSILNININLKLFYLLHIFVYIHNLCM